MKCFLLSQVGVSTYLPRWWAVPEPSWPPPPRTLPYCAFFPDRWDTHTAGLIGLVTLGTSHKTRRKLIWPDTVFINKLKMDKCFNPCTRCRWDTTSGSTIANQSPHNTCLVWRTSQADNFTVHMNSLTHSTTHSPVKETLEDFCTFLPLNLVKHMLWADTPLV